MTSRQQSYDIAPDAAATVLLVDDEPYLLEEMAEVLENAGYRCLTANHANQAYEIIQQDDDIGLVVTDIRMPGLDGVEFIREMKNKSRREQNLAMVVLSGHAGFDEAVRAMRAGAEDFLTKPASPDDLLRSIGRALTMTTLRRTESQFREGLATQSEEKARTIEQMQETLRAKNKYIESLESTCEMALSHGRCLTSIAHEITASVTTQIRSTAAGANGLEGLVETLNYGLDTLEVCASLRAQMSATDIILGRADLTAQAKALKTAVSEWFSRGAMILKIEPDLSDRMTGVGSLEFFGGVCATLLCTAGRADPGSRIELTLAWQEQGLGATIHFYGKACYEAEMAFMNEPRLIRTYSPLVDPRLYVARRLLGEGAMSLGFKQGEDTPHCFNITTYKSVT